MSKIEIIYIAKCKDCIFIKEGYIINKNGEMSKRKSHSCDNIKSKLYNTIISKRDKACDEFKLIND